jgi:hypothetical protein
MMRTGRRAAERDGMISAAAASSPAPRPSDVSWAPTADAAFHHLHDWLNGGPPPPRQRPIAISGEPPAVTMDALGNAAGGIRLPELEAPIARYTFTGAENDYFGDRTPFTREQLMRLYPSHEIYVERVRRSAIAAQQVGVIPAYRVKEYIEAAQKAVIPN